MIDLILCRDSAPTVTSDDAILHKLTDHIPQLVTLPFPYTPPPARTAAPPVPIHTYYKWIEGTSVFNYADSAKAWREHTDTATFKTALLTVVHDPALDNDARSQAVEAFLLDQAVAAGVVKKVECK